MSRGMLARGAPRKDGGDRLLRAACFNTSDQVGLRQTDSVNSNIRSSAVKFLDFCKHARRCRRQ